MGRSRCVGTKPLGQRQPHAPPSGRHYLNYKRPQPQVIVGNLGLRFRSGQRSN